MESHEVLHESGVGGNNSMTFGSGNGLEEVAIGEKDGENLGCEILEDLELYLEDINERLTISRMVSDSVIKGMVSAMEQESAEKVAIKELELENLKKVLQFYDVGIDNNKSLVSPDLWQYLSSSDACLEHDKMRDSLGHLRKKAGEQFKKLKKEIDGLQRHRSIRRNSSGSDLMGLSGILMEDSQCWFHVDTEIDNLAATVDMICVQASHVLQISKKLLCEWQLERDIQGDLEAMVMQISIQSLQAEFEEKIWDRNAQLCGAQSVNWLEKLNEISNLRKELDALLKSVSNPETGHLISQGSHDIDSHISPSTSPWKGNGKAEDSKTDVPEHFDAAQLKHMSRDEMVNYFNAELMKMRRQHESKEQEITEKYFSLKREYLNTRGSSVPHRKDKEFDVLRRKIPEFIVKLDNILEENENLPAFPCNAETLSSLRNRLDTLLSENRQLRDSINDKKNEVKCLSAQLAESACRMSQHSLSEASMRKLIGNLKSALEDAQVEASVHEEVNRCILKEALDSESTRRYDIEDLDLDSLFVEGMLREIFQESIKEVGGKYEELHREYLIEKENGEAIAVKALDNEKKLELEVQENENLRKNIFSLDTLMKEKEKLAMDMSDALAKEKEQFELASRELKCLTEQSISQEKSISENRKELESVKGQLAVTLEEIEKHKVRLNQLNEKLEHTEHELKNADEQTNMFRALAKERHDKLLSVECKENELRKQMEVVIYTINSLSTLSAGYENKVAERIKDSNLRLEEFHSQLNYLAKKANGLRRTMLKHKQRLERKCANLQMAEAEVDLLGDEVDALLNLLEKIYIALDHYSPVLQHYPGITEILKLIKRELSEERIKPV